MMRIAPSVNITDASSIELLAQVCAAAFMDVRFTPESGHSLAPLECPLLAQSMVFAPGTEISNGYGPPQTYF